ncbi:MAG: sigma-70 family RNA polymerase sigma factor [Vulcanimicrobiaceae bacterium]
MDVALDTWLEGRLPDHRERVIESHRYLCRRAARKFLRRGVERADLEQVAAIGLIKAVDRYDRRYEIPFDAYAWRLVLGELMHYVRDAERLIRVPRRLRELDRRYGLVESELCSELGRTPAEDEIFAVLGGTQNDRRDLQSYRRSLVVMSFESLRPIDQPNLSYTMETHLDGLSVDRGISSLSTIEQEIIRQVYERDTPMTEIAKALGYSRRHVSRLHNAAIKKLLRFVRPPGGG